MATYTVTRTKHATLAATTVDTIHFTGSWGSVEILNRAAAGGADMYATWCPENSPNTALPADPVPLADETFIIPAGMSYELVNSGSAAISWRLKLVGNANPYSVTGGRG